MLIEHGADVNAVNGIDEDGVGGCTALIYAIMNSRTAIVDLLIRSGADVNAKGLGSRTPLEMARQRMTRAGFDEGIVERLERAGAAEEKDDVVRADRREGFGLTGPCSGRED